MHEAEGVPLPGGRMTSGLVRQGDRVRRPTGPWLPAVHEYLRHLAAAAFETSPRVLAGSTTPRPTWPAPVTRG